MIRLTDPDGDSCLFQEHYIIAVVPYNVPPEQKAGMVPRDFIRTPRSLVILPDKGFPVMETIDEIDMNIRLGGIGGQGQEST